MRKAGGTTLRTALEKLYFDKRLEILVGQQDEQKKDCGGFTLHHQVCVLSAINYVLSADSSFLLYY